MKRSIMAFVLAAGLGFAGSALAQEKLDKIVKVGSLGDQSGLYQDIGGPGSSVAAQMAIEDSGLLAKGWKIDLISGDHQNKPDVGSNIAKQWIDVEKVDVFVDLASSGVGLAVANVAKERNVVNLNSGSASSDLTGSQCSPNTVHWVYDTYMLANGTGKALVKSGGDTWFFLTADYAFGQALERDTSAVVVANGGTPSTTPISPLSCCRRRVRRRKSSDLPMPAATPRMRSSRRRSSASSRAGKSSRAC
jgi:branched-chain amino acid transport system substrate-binding protein